jgi:DNA-binding transcriptional LysR family regulator
MTAINLRHLDVLRAVVQTGTATGAAHRVYLTQSAVSRAIAGLEHQLGFRIFDRIKQRLVLTEQGTAFFQEAERLLSGLDELHNVARDIREKRIARLRIVAMPALAHGVLPIALARLEEAHPQISVSIEIRHRAEVTRWVAGRQFDVGFAGLPVDYPGVVNQPLVAVKALAAIPASNRKLARMKSIAASDLAKEEMIGLGADTMVQSRVSSYFHKHNLAPKVKIESTSLLSVCHFVAAGLGCGIVDPFTASAAMSDKIVFRPMRPELTLEYGALFQRQQTPTPLIVEVCALVKSVANELNLKMQRS